MRTILIVEDEAVWHMYFTTLMSRVDPMAQIIFVADLEDALPIFRRFKDQIDLVLMDGFIPEKRGLDEKAETLELTRIIRSEWNGPIIGTSMMRDFPPKQKEAGCTDICSKEKLRPILEQFVEKFNAQKAA